MSCAVQGAWDITDHIDGMPNLMKTICLSSILYCSTQAIWHRRKILMAMRTNKHNYLKVKISSAGDLVFPKRREQ